MKKAKNENNILELVEILRSHAFRNISGITDQKLYFKCYTKTKQLIEDFI